MESSLSFFSAFCFSCFFLFLASLSPANAQSQLVPIVCRKTISNPECLAALKADPQSISATNYEQLAEAALDSAIANAKDSQGFIEGLAKTDPRDPIRQCVADYGAVIGSFSSAKAELKEDPETANYDAKVAFDSAISCETALSSGEVKVDEISKRNHVVQLFSSIGDVITSELW